MRQRGPEQRANQRQVGLGPHGGALDVRGGDGDLGELLQLARGDRRVEGVPARAREELVGGLGDVGRLLERQRVGGASDLHAEELGRRAHDLDVEALGEVDLEGARECTALPTAVMSLPRSMLST